MGSWNIQRVGMLSLTKPTQTQRIKYSKIILKFSDHAPRYSKTLNAHLCASLHQVPIFTNAYSQSSSPELRLAMIYYYAGLDSERRNSPN